MASARHQSLNDWSFEWGMSVCSDSQIHKYKERSEYDFKRHSQWNENNIWHSIIRFDVLIEIYEILINFYWNTYPIEWETKLMTIGESKESRLTESQRVKKVCHRSHQRDVSSLESVSKCRVNSEPTLCWLNQWSTYLAANEMRWKTRQRMAEMAKNG